MNETERNILVEENINLVKWTIGEFFTIRSRDDFDDFFQEGCQGLIRAASDYDENMGMFSTYAVPWIRNYINRYILKNRIVRIPENKVQTLKQTTRDWISEGKRQTFTEYCQEHGYGEDLIAAYKADKCSTAGSEDDTTVKSYFKCSASVDVAQECVDSDMKDRVLKAVSILPERDQRILALRYGLFGNTAHTLRELSDKLGMTPEGIRQIEIRSQKKIRKTFPSLAAFVN